MLSNLNYVITAKSNAANHFLRKSQSNPEHHELLNSVSMQNALGIVRTVVVRNVGIVRSVGIYLWIVRSVDMHIRTGIS
jgi:hypothetical protein